MLGGNKEEMSFAERMNPCECLYAHYGGVIVAKYFALWSLISSALKSDADKRVCVFSTGSPVAELKTIISFTPSENARGQHIPPEQINSSRTPTAEKRLSYRSR